jgi:hypothetical protein
MIKHLRIAALRWWPATITAIALVVSGLYYQAAAENATAASDSLVACRQLAAQIRQLQQQTTHASLVSRPLTDLADLVERSAVGAGLTRDNIVRVDPEAVRRVGDTDYREQATEIELNAAALDQVRQLVDGLSAHDSNLEVRTLRLRTPHEEASSDAAEKWLAELILTQRIYAPKNAGP